MNKALNKIIVNDIYNADTLIVNILKNLVIVGLGFLILYWITFPLVQSWSLIYSDVNLSNGLNLIIY